MIQNQELNFDGVTRVSCDLRINYSTRPPKTKYLLQYKIIMNNQVEIVPWTDINQCIINDCNENYFDSSNAYYFLLTFGLGY